MDDALYIASVMEALDALESFGSLPLEGGYLNQPVTFIKDIQAVRGLLKERRAKSMKAAMAIREAAAQTVNPSAPLPPVPKGLL